MAKNSVGQSEADKAYAVAEQMIAEALRDGAEGLSFYVPEFRELQTLPKSISNLPKLRILILRGTQISDISELSRLTDLNDLDLRGTPVTDISALQELTNLMRLQLNGTKVKDITPLEGLKRLERLHICGTLVADISVLSKMENLKRLDLNGSLVSDLTPIKNLDGLSTGKVGTSAHGLSFLNSPAIVSDPTLAEIAEIEDSHERTKQALAYLREQLPEDKPAAPSYTLPQDGPMRADTASMQGWDETKLAMLEEVREKVSELITAIGDSNECAGLKRTAQKYQAQVDKPPEKMVLELIWSAANSMRRAHHADEIADVAARVNDLLPPLIGAALADLVETHGLFIMGFPKAVELETRMRDYVDGPRNDTARELAQEIVQVLDNKPDALMREDFDAVEEDAITASDTGPDGAMAEARLIGHIWNMVGAAGRAVKLAIKVGVVAGGATLLQHDFIQLLSGNETLIMKFLTAVSTEAPIWFLRIIMMIKEALNVAF